MKSITKEYEISANISEVYKALTNSEVISIWSGAPAVMDVRQNGEFSLWEGSIHGINKLISETKIIQDWKENTWSSYSKVVFNIEKKGDKTLLKLIHNEIPDSSAKSIDNGWDTYYLGPLKEYLEEKLLNF